MPAEIPRIYVLVRTDIPLAQQLVQVGHAAFMAGARFGCPDYHHLVLCGVAGGSRALHDAAYFIDKADIAHVMFLEPDLTSKEGEPFDSGFTALCTEPVIDPRQRKVFRRFPLWQAPS